MIEHDLAHYAANINEQEIPTDVKEKVKICFLDWLGCTIAGADDETSIIFKEILQNQGAERFTSSLIGFKQKTSPLNAALVNGVSSHVLELDDVYTPGLYHPSVPLFPAILAVSEEQEISGKAFITAAVAGYEIALRLAEAINPSHYQYWHTTGTVGTFSAAVGVGRLLGLSTNQMMDAMGNAGTQASGLWQFVEDGAMTKPLHPGKAAFNGTLSAYLAARNFTGAKRILSGQKGFCQATSQQIDLSKLDEGLGEIYKINDNSIKLYASCRYTHAAIEGVLDLLRKNRLTAESVQKLEIYSSEVAVDIAGIQKPKNISEARFSMPYCAAVGMVFGRASIKEFTSSILQREDVQKLISKTELFVDEGMTAIFPEKLASIVVIQTQKDSYRCQVDYPKGEPKNPVNKEEILEKFLSLVENKLSPAEGERLAYSILHLEDFENMALLLEPFPV